jgi:hypothetical protein
VVDSVVDQNQEAATMAHRIHLCVGIAIFLVLLLAPGAALATVKCQCNNGTLSHAMGADYDDEDVEESCDEACSELGGGRVWSVDSDRDDNDDVTIRRGERRDHSSARR